MPTGAEMVCQIGNRSRRVCPIVRQHHWTQPWMEPEGAIPAWQRAGVSLRRHDGAPMPLMRQVQLAAGSLVLPELVLSASVAPAWIALCWRLDLGLDLGLDLDLGLGLDLGLTVAALTGFCGRARLLAVVPWNRVGQPTEPV